MIAKLQDVRSPDFIANTYPGPVLIFLHGFGSNEHDLSSLAEVLDLDLPWASLRAPLQLAQGGAAWFEITTPGAPDAAPVERATEAIWDWIEKNLHPAAQVIPVGFSQGGLMASQLLRTRPQRVLAPVILGGFVLAAAQPADSQLRSDLPAVFWGRGEHDRVIAPAAIARTKKFLPEHSSLEQRIYPGLEHGINAAELRDVHHFISAHLASTA